MIKVLEQKVTELNGKLKDTAERLQSNISLEAKIGLLHEAESAINAFKADAERISGLMFHELHEKGSSLHEDTIRQLCSNAINPDNMKSLVNLIENENNKFNLGITDK